MAGDDSMNLRTPGEGPPESFEVAILAGDFGTRQGETTGRLPHPLMPLLGTPLLAYQIDLCRRHGFTRVLLLTPSDPEVIQAHFGDGARFGVRLGYQVAETPRGTAGALRDALPQLDDTFLVMHGDTYIDVDLRQMWSAHAARPVDATLFVHPTDHPQDSDLVELDTVGLVTALRPYPRQQAVDARNLVNAGLYVLTRTHLDAMIPASGRVDLARDTFPHMLEHKARLWGYRSAEYIQDVGTPERLDRAAVDIESGLTDRLSGRTPRAAVFLDRDGTINREVNYLTRPEQLELIGDAAEAIRRLNRAGCLAVVVTNQSVVARGDLTLDGLERVHGRLEYLLGVGGAYLDRIYACPHHPDLGFAGEVAEFRVTCDCRKPATGSIDAACRDLGIGRGESWLIGDTTSDIETGRRAGLRTVLVRTGHAGQDGRFPFDPNYVVTNLAAAVSWILSGHPAMMSRMTPVAATVDGARLVLVGGLAQAGKSSAAQVLKETTSTRGRTAHVLPLDSWLKPTTAQAAASGVTARYDVAGMLAAVLPLVGSSARVTLDWPVYDRAHRAMYARQRLLSIDPDDLLIVEGVPALLVDELVRPADIRLYVEVPESDRLSRLHADYRWHGTSDAAVESLLLSRAADETAPVEAAKTRADFIVPGWTAA